MMINPVMRRSFLISAFVRMVFYHSQLRTIVDAFDLCRGSLLSVRHLNYFIYSAEPRVARNSWARKFGLADDPA
jgi:hypothetical protein